MAQKWPPATRWSGAANDDDGHDDAGEFAADDDPGDVGLAFGIAGGEGAPPDDDEAAEFFDSVATVRGLQGVARLSRLLPGIDWFGAAGQPVPPPLRAEALAYAEVLGVWGPELACPETWDDAAELVLAQDFDPDFWRAEAQIAEPLMDQALALLPAHDLRVALSHVSFSAAQLARAKAARLLAVCGRDDEEVLLAAAQAAAAAAAQAGLALALQSAGSSDPGCALFLGKFALFERGRWPLGMIGNSLFLF